MGRTEGRFVLCPLIGFVNRLEPLIIADVLYERLHLPQPRLHRFQLSAGTVIGAVNILDFGLKVSISEKTILGEIADGTGSFLKVVDLRPMLIAFAFLYLDTILNVYNEGDAFSLCLHPLLTGIASSDAFLEPFFGIVFSDCFCAGEPFLSLSAEGNVLARFDFISGLLHQL